MTRFIFGAAIFIGAVVGVGCGGGKDSPATATATASVPAAAPAATATPSSTPAPASNKFDPAKADALAHASMLSVTDLPGGGWTVSKKDDFTESPPSTTASCASVNTAQKTFQAALDANRAGRAEIELSKTAAAALLPASAEFLVYIYPDSKAAAAPLGAYRGMVDIAAFAKCFEDEMASDASVTAKVTKASTAVSAPDNGVSAAFDVAITAGSVTITLRVETYAWQSSNAFVGVNLSGPKDVVTTDLATAAVRKFQAAMEAAASGR